MQNAKYLKLSTGTHSFPKKLRESANPTLVHKIDHRVFQISSHIYDFNMNLYKYGEHAYIAKPLLCA